MGIRSKDLRIITGAPVRGADFFGRSAEVERTWQRLAHGSVLLTAPRRHGKTSLMYGLIDQPLDGWHTTIADVEYIDQISDLLETLLAALLANHPIRSAISKLKKVPAEFLNWIKGGLEEVELGASSIATMRLKLSAARPAADWRDLGDMVCEAIRALPIEDRYLIVLDEFPIFLQALLQENEEDAEKFLQWFRATRMTLERTRFLVGGSINLETTLEHRGMSALINDLEVVRLRPFGDSVAREFTHGLLEPCLDVATGDREQVALAILDRIGEGVPFFLQLLSGEVSDAINIEGREPSIATVNFVYEQRVLGPDCRSRFAHYRSRLREYYHGDDELRARLILCKISDYHAHDLDDIVALLIALDLDQLGGTQTERIVRRLESDYYIEQRGGKIKFLHRVLADWWRVNIRPPKKGG